jgi:ribosome-associated translation inhibitor RaiA
MKSTEAFKTIIQQKLEEMAEADPLFAVNYRKDGKNIDDCITYILNTVKKSGCNGFTDDEIFGMAAHYYDEDNLEVGKKINCDVIVNHQVELTEEEKKQARQAAIDRVIAEEKERILKRHKAKQEQTKTTVQQSLF